jgi:hypothetical protein
MGRPDYQHMLTKGIGGLNQVEPCNSFTNIRPALTYSIIYQNTDKENIHNTSDYILFISK